jgi:predicted transcriptional regulator
MTDDQYAMKVKFKTIGINRSEDTLKDAAETMQSIVQGRKTRHVSACYFASMKAFHNVLTPQRYELLKVIRKSRPASVKELAAILGRDGSSVQADVDALVNMDIIELEDHGEQRSPRVHYEGIRVEMVI